MRPAFCAGRISSGDRGDAVLLRPRLPGFPGDEVGAFAAVAIINIEEGSDHDALIERLDLLFGPHVQGHFLFDFNMVHPCRSAGRMRPRGDGVDVLQCSRVADLVEEHAVCMFPLVDRRARGARERSAVPSEDVDARMRPMDRLHAALVLEDLRELVGVGAGDENGSICLVEAVVFDVPQDAELAPFVDDTLLVARKRQLHG